MGIFSGPVGGIHIPIPFGGGAYFTPGGVRAGAANFTIALAWNEVAGDLVGIGLKPPQLAATNGDPKDKSEVVGKLAAAAAWIIAKDGRETPGKRYRIEGGETAP